MISNLRGNRLHVLLALSLLVLVLAACSAASVADEPEAAERETATEPAIAETEAVPTDELESTPSAIEATEETRPADAVADEASDEMNTEEESVMTEDNRSERLRALTASWETNWNQHTIPYDEILSGGPPRDGIPSIDAPQFISQEEATEWLAGNEPVIALEIEGDVRAYPLQILTWHEIVNDTVGGIPVAVTFCPLCNSAIVFDRRLDGEVYEFGTSGLLRHSDLIMYDRTTESLWQQFTGEAIVGDLVGKRLTFISAPLISFDDFRSAYPEGVVLSRETGFNRRYGTNPYAGYDRIGQDPFLFRGETDERLPAMARVVTVSVGDVSVAYPYDVLAQEGVVHDEVNAQELVVFFTSGTSSALDAAQIAEGADVGATAVFDPNLDGQVLTFTQDDGTFVDEETGSTWNILGQATAGPLAGEELAPITHANPFWFSWAAFQPDTIIYGS